MSSIMINLVKIYFKGVDNSRSFNHGTSTNKNFLIPTRQKFSKAQQSFRKTKRYNTEKMERKIPHGILQKLEMQLRLQLPVQCLVRQNTALY